MESRPLGKSCDGAAVHEVSEVAWGVKAQHHRGAVPTALRMNELAQLTQLCRGLGATPEQADIMARQLIKRADLIKKLPAPEVAAVAD